MHRSSMAELAAHNGLTKVRSLPVRPQPRLRTEGPTLRTLVQKVRLLPGLPQRRGEADITRGSGPRVGGSIPSVAANPGRGPLDRPTVF